MAGLLWIYAGVRTLMDLLGGIDFVVERSTDPGWLASVFYFLVDPPSWFLLGAIAVGLVLVLWPTSTTKGRRYAMSAPVIGMVLFGAAFVLCLGWWMLFRPHTPASRTVPPEDTQAAASQAAHGDAPAPVPPKTIAEKRAAERAGFLLRRQELEAAVFDADGDLAAANFEPNPADGRLKIGDYEIRTSLSSGTGAYLYAKSPSVKWLAKVGNAARHEIFDISQFHKAEGAIPLQTGECAVLETNDGHVIQLLLVSARATVSEDDADSASFRYRIYDRGTKLVEALRNGTQKAE